MREKCIFTIGVYGSTEESFFRAILDNEIDCFCDVRSRRGLRGSKYAYANSIRLQSRLQDLGVPYIHLKHLAPSVETRQAQKDLDSQAGVAKRDRLALGEVFVRGYTAQCLCHLNSENLLSGDLNGFHRPVFFCVEREPEACHRSLLADVISRDLGLQVQHLIP